MIYNIMPAYDLCEELIVEIFTRLPPKSLLRFRSVSKSLCGCIGSPDFIRLHALRSPNKIMVVHHVYTEGGLDYKDMYTLHSGCQMSCDPSTGVTAADYPFEYFTVVGSCNGILCLHEYQNSIYLWNPSIRRKLTRPSWRNPGSQWGPIGFGFDPVVDDYKILVVSECTNGKRVERRTFVCTTKTDAWREIASPVAPFAAIFTSSQCLFNGALHRVVRRCLTFSGDDRHYYIMTFGLSSEVFSTIELPEPTWETNHVTTVNGSLAVLSSKHDNTLIWVRNDTTASWSVAFKLSARECEGASRVYQINANDDLLFNPFCDGIIVYNQDSRA